MLTAALLLASLAAPVTLDRQGYLMGTPLEIVVEGRDRARAIAASERALAALEATEARLSTWREDSELQRLNRTAPGTVMALSAELRADLAEAIACSRATGGAFDPGVGGLVEIWGLRSGGRQPSPPEIATALAGAGIRFLDLGPGEATRRRLGLRLDEGGFGKGAGLDRALAALRAAGARSAWLDLGGQIAVLRRARTVALAHPADRRTSVLEVVVDHGSLATSGTSERGRHLLDPRRGVPADDFGSLTVWAPTAFEADCLSTGLYVLGPDAALEWAAARPDVEVAVLEATDRGVRVRLTPGLAEHVVETAPGTTLITFSRRFRP